MNFDFKFWYEAIVRMRKERHSVCLLYEGRETISLRSISARDAALAFRISARQPPNRKTATEILCYENKLWWLLELPQAPGRILTSERLQALLLDPNFHLLGISPSNECRYAYTPLEVDENIAKVYDDARESVLQQAKQKLYENIIVCEGIAYALGGAPLLIHDPRGRPHFINPGHSRAVDLLKEGLFFISEPLMREELQSIFRAGTMKSASDAATYVAWPRIEIFQQAAETVGLIDHRVDACFRAIVGALDAGGEAFMANVKGDSTDITSLEAEFQHLKGSVAANSARSHRGGNIALTSARAANLRDFASLVESAQPDLGRTELANEAHRTFLAAVYAGYDLNEKFGDADEEALDRFADLENPRPRRRRRRN